MRETYLLGLLEKVREGRIGIQEAAKQLEALPYRDIGYAKVDHHRALRKGFAEVIFCQGKTEDQVAGIAKELSDRGSNVLATRAESNVYERLRKVYPQCEYYPEARIVHVSNAPVPETGQCVWVLSGGTADMPVAEEAAVTAEKLGNRVERLYDVGVAGIHRLLDFRERWSQAAVLIVVAGMEGALPSVVGGLTDAPLIAVPTSIGYGCNMGGVTALFAMLTGCSSGVAVVNIDNGFGAGYMAATITRRIARQGSANA